MVLCVCVCVSLNFSIEFEAWHPAHKCDMNIKHDQFSLIKPTNIYKHTYKCIPYNQKNTQWQGFFFGYNSHIL